MKITYVNGDIYENFDAMKIKLFDREWEVRCITDRYSKEEIGSLYCEFKELAFYIHIIKSHNNKIIARVDIFYVLDRECCNLRKYPGACVRSDMVQILKNNKIYFEAREDNCYYSSDLQKTLNEEVQNNSDIQELIMKLSGKKFRKILGLFFFQSCRETFIKKAETKISIE